MIARVAATAVVVALGCLCSQRRQHLRQDGRAGVGAAASAGAAPCGLGARRQAQDRRRPVGTRSLSHCRLVSSPPLQLSGAYGRPQLRHSAVSLRSRWPTAHAPPRARGPTPAAALHRGHTAVQLCTVRCPLACKLGAAHCQGAVQLRNAARLRSRRPASSARASIARSASWSVASCTLACASSRERPRARHRPRPRPRRPPPGQPPRLPPSAAIIAGDAACSVFVAAAAPARFGARALYARNLRGRAGAWSLAATRASQSAVVSRAASCASSAPPGTIRPALRRHSLRGHVPALPSAFRLAVALRLQLGQMTRRAVRGLLQRRRLRRRASERSLPSSPPAPASPVSCPPSAAPGIPRVPPRVRSRSRPARSQLLGLVRQAPAVRRESSSSMARMAPDPPGCCASVGSDAPESLPGASSARFHRGRPRGCAR